MTIDPATPNPARICGLPTQVNTHDVVRDSTPVVYVDNKATVAAHGMTCCPDSIAATSSSATSASRTRSRSKLAPSHGTVHKLPHEHLTTAEQPYSNGGTHPLSGTYEEVARLFDGMGPKPPRPGVEPGVASGGTGRAEDPSMADDDASGQLYVGVARKP